MKQKIKHFIEGNLSESYFEIPFEMPENAEKFCLSYCFDSSQNVVDFGINDNFGRLVGWAGAARKSVTVGETFSSDGFEVLPLEKGKWSIIVGAYKISSGGCDVEFELEFFVKKPRYFFGDLHVHTTASDGELTLQQVIELARQKSLDFLAITDHNSCCQNKCLPNLPDLTFLRGVEWTHYFGHINMFGLENPFEKSFLAHDSKGAVEILDFAKSKGALISANHPTDPACPLKWDFEYDFDLFEVTNGPVRPSNITAVKMWDEMLKKGKIVHAVGGSDFHNLHGAPVLATPTTAIFANSSSPKDLFDALKAGHCLVTDKKGGIMLELTCQGKMAGDVVKFSEIIEGNSAMEKQLQGQNVVDVTDENSEFPTVEISVTATNLPEKYFLAIFTENGEIHRCTANQAGQKLTATVIKNTVGYVRAVVATSAGFLMPFIPIAISNPIYLK